MTSNESFRAPPSEAARPPSRVARFPVYYGWVIVAAAAMGMVMTGPGQTYAFSLFTDHFIRDLGVTRSTVSTLYSFGTLLAGLTLPFVGRQMDRVGSRTMVTVVAVAFGAACLYMSTVQNALMLGLGFVALRLLGQGSLQLVSQTVVNRWWVRHRGKMLGIIGVVVAVFGPGATPNLLNDLIGRVGWRNTYILMGAALFAIMVPVGSLLFRNQPEDHGLQPDGGPPTRTAGSDAPHFPQEEHWEAREAVRTRAFWIVAAGAGIISMLSTGLFFHMVSIFQDNGLPPSVAASAYMPVAATLAVTHLSGGVLADRIPVRFLLVAALLLQAAALVVAGFLQSTPVALAYGAILGASGGLAATVSGVVWPTYFGRRHLGSILGMAGTINVIGSALGPMPLGIARDVLGSYDSALLVSAILPIILAVAAATAKPPHRRNTAT